MRATPVSTPSTVSTCDSAAAFWGREEERAGHTTCQRPRLTKQHSHRGAHAPAQTAPTPPESPARRACVSVEASRLCAAEGPSRALHCADSARPPHSSDTNSASSASLPKPVLQPQEDMARAQETRRRTRRHSSHAAQLMLRARAVSCCWCGSDARREAECAFLVGRAPKSWGVGCQSAALGAHVSPAREARPCG